MLDSVNPKKDRSSSYLHGEGASSSIENAGIAYQSPSLLAAGAGAREIAWLSTITNLLFALLLIKAPSIIKSGESLKKVTVILGIVSVLGWLPLIIIPLVFQDISPVVLILLWIISLVPSMMIGPLRDKWLSDLVPSSRLGGYLSIRSIISAGTYITSFFVMGYFLDHFQRGAFNGFTVIFLASFLVSSISLVLYLIIKMPVAIGGEAQSDMGFLAFIREAKQNDLGTLIIFSAMIIFTASICGAFFSVYMLKDLHFSYLTFTLVLSVEYISRMVISYFGGRWIDRAGAVKVLHFASFLIPMIPILWVFSSNIGYILVIQIASGFAWATYDLCIQSYLFRASPPSKRLHYIIYQRSIVTLAAATGPLLGAFLLNFQFPFFTNPILPIFLISGALRFLVVIAILPRLKDTRADIGEQGSESLEPIGVSVIRPVQTEIPLYSAARNITNPAIHRFGESKREVKLVSFYRNRPSIPSPLDSPRAVTENIRQDLLYHADPHFQFTKITPTYPESQPKVARLQSNRQYLANNPDDRIVHRLSTPIQRPQNVASRT
jgi:MFS family permease